MKLVVLLFAFVSLLACSEHKSKTVNTAVQESRKPAADSSELPNLPLTFADGTRKSIKELSGKIALVLFQPDCDHCQREAEEISKHLLGFKDFQLYLVSSAPIDEVISFARRYRLDNKKNVTLATTTVTDILREFGPIDAPSIYLYSREGNLIQSFNGEVAIEVVLKYI